MKTILLSLIRDVNREMYNIGKPNNLGEVWSTEFTIFHSIFPEIVSETSASTRLWNEEQSMSTKKK